MSNFSDPIIPRYDIRVRRNANYTLTFQWKDKDVTGYAFKMQIRPDKGDTGTPILAASTTAGTITVAPDPGGDFITINIPAADTAALTVPFTGEYDVRYTDGSGDSYYLFEGTAHLEDSVTE